MVDETAAIVDRESKEAKESKKSAGSNESKGSSDIEETQKISNEFPAIGQPQLIASPYWGPQEDEVSLIDIALVILRHKKVLFGTFIAIVMLGALAIFMMPAKYKYAVVLEAGSYALPDESGNLGEKRFIEPIEHTKSNLQTSFIPQIVLERLLENPELPIPEFTVNVPKGASLLEISAQSTEGREELVKSILSDIADQVALDHQNKSVDVIEQLRQNVESMEIKVRELTTKLIDQQKIQEAAKVKLSNLDEKQGLLSTQIERVNLEVERLQQHRVMLLKEDIGSRDALALLLVDNAISQSNRQRDELERSLHIALKNEQVELQRVYEQRLTEGEMLKVQLERAEEILSRFSGDSSVGGTVGQVGSGSENIGQGQAKDSRTQRSKSGVDAGIDTDGLAFVEVGKNIYPTHRAVEPYREIIPEGLGKVVKLAIVGIMAGFVALMMTFIAEFVGRVRRQTA